MRADYDVAIVGPGPYGLSLAAHLRDRGISFRIFGEPMQFWRAHMPKGMHLKSDGFASNLYDADRSYTLKTFCAEEELSYHDTAVPVRLETFVRYGLSFQSQFAPDVQRNNVLYVAKTSNAFALSLDNDEVATARRVVIATGILSFRHIPSSLNHLPPEFVSHSSQHHDLCSFSNRNIVVLGAGASATDLAVLLHEAGATVQLVARHHVRFHSGGSADERPLWEKVRHPSSGIGPGLRARFYCDAPWLFHHFPERLRLFLTRRTLGPAGAWFIKDKVLGHIPLVLGFEPKEAEIKNGRVRLKLRGADDSERELITEHIIAATGYKVDLRQLEFLSPELISHLAMVANTPVLSSTMESAVPGLYFIGAATANSFGPVMRFAFGARFVAPHLARALVKSLSSRQR